MKIVSYSPIIIFTVFLYSFFISLSYEVSTELRQQLFLVTSSLFLIYYIKFYNVCMNSVAVISGVVMSLSTFLLFFSIIYDISWLYDVFDAYGAMAAGSRDVGNGIQQFFRLGGVPFLFVSFAILARKISIKFDVLSLLLLLLILASILLSSTRSIIVGCFLIVFFLFFKKYIVISICLFFFSIIYFLFNFKLSGGFFDVNDFGNAIKLKDASSFLDWTDASNVIFGEGLASLYFSGGRGYFVAQTEITILDNVRYFGVLLTLLFYAQVLFPSFKTLALKVDGGFYFSVMIIYVLMALTNPMLINSFGFIVILWYWSNVLGVKNERIVT